MRASSTESVATLTARLTALYDRVGAFFARVAARYGDGQVTCHDGCDSCCQAGLTVTGLEAALIQAHLRGLPEHERVAVARSSGRPGCAALDSRRAGCAALDAEGRCRIYAVRPLVCRAHGLPLRFAGEARGRSLPMIDACPKNFIGTDLEALAPSDVLDQATLSTILLALSSAHADLEGQPRDARYAIADLLDLTCSTAQNPPA